MKIKKLILPFLFILGFLSTRAQSGFYDSDSIQIIEITFANNNWDFQLDTAKAGSGDYVPATSVKVNGIVFDSVGVKYKGNSSYDSTQSKNPLHIKLDYYYSNAQYDGVKDIKLSNGFSDPSMVREVLAYQILRNYMDAPLCNFAKVYINGVYYGVFTNSEDISKQFLLRHFNTSYHSFIKCNPENVVNGHIPSLVYLGQDSTLYYDRYELKSDFSWKDLVDLCDTLANANTAIDEILDVDRALWMLAFNNVTVNLDSYTGAFAQNYYLYRDHNGRFTPVIWDLNMCFGGFTNTGTGNLSIPSMQMMSPVLHSTNPSRPLIMNLLADARYKKMYVAHMRTMNEEFFESGDYFSDAQWMQALIDTSVQAENFSLYSYPQFQQGLTTDVGTVPGIDHLMASRAAFLDTTSEFQLVSPEISGINLNPSTPVFGTNVSILATVSNGSSVFLGYRYKKSDRFVRVLMLDDGLHNDGIAGDMEYGVSIPANSLDIQYYIYAENSDAGIFSPERAEFEFYSFVPSINSPSAGDVVINEFLGDNFSGIMNEEGKHKDWIELFNNTNEALGLKGFWLSDNFSNPAKWNFPEEAFIPANGFLLVWADDNDADWIDFHANFNIGNAGDSLILVDSAITWFDSLTFSSPGADTSFARCPDGSGIFQKSIITTPRTSNICSLISRDEIIPIYESIILYPNPSAGESKYICGNEIELSEIQILSVEGVVLKSFDPSRDSILNFSEFASGIYFMSFVEKSGATKILRLIKL